MTSALATTLGWNLSISLSAIVALATFVWSAYQFLDVVPATLATVNFTHITSL